MLKIPFRIRSKFSIFGQTSFKIKIKRYDKKRLFKNILISGFHLRPPEEVDVDVELRVLFFQVPVWFRGPRSEGTLQHELKELVEVPDSRVTHQHDVDALAVLQPKALLHFPIETSSL